MRKKLLFTALLMLMSICMAQAQTGPADNEIWYTSSAKLSSISISSTTWGATVSSHSYSSGTKKGVITCNGDVTKIGSKAFKNQTNLTSITIPNKVTTIAYEAFNGCTNLNSVTMPNSLTSIANDVFNGCTSLTSITIPSSVTTINAKAFVGCTELATIVVESGNTTFDSRNNCNAIIKTSNDSLIAGCKSTTIPDGVVSIGNFAFKSCSSLTSITIPNSVISIGQEAFHETGLTSIAIPNSVTSIGDMAFLSCENLGSVTFGNSLTTIGTEAFSGCAMESISLPETLESIGSEAFYECTSLETFNIPNSVTSIGQNAFLSTAWWDAQESSSIVYKDNCLLGLVEGYYPEETVVIADGTRVIADYSFSEFSSMPSVTIPNSVVTIGGSAFAYCSSLESVTIPNSVTNLGDGAFMCTGLTSVVIPNSITSVGDGTFGYCDNLASVVIPSSVTSIGYEAFAYMSSGGYICVAWDDPTDIEVLETSFDYGQLIYVPSGSKSNYEIEPWIYFTIKDLDIRYTDDDGEILNEVETELTIDDTYHSFTSYCNKTIDITYTRTFNNNNWQALYVPFAIPMESLENFEVAQMTGKSASSNNVVISRITSGTLSANTPYFIKLKSGQEASQSIFVEDATLEPTNACGHTSGDYTLTGIYSRMTGVELKAAGDPYALSGGEFKQANDAAILGAFRFYLTGVPSSGKIDIEFADAPTGVESLSPALSSKEGEIFNLQGIRVNENYKGIVIVDGKKYLLK